jgi:hypothetical protein
VVHTEIAGLHQDLKNVWCETREPHEAKLPIDELFQIKESLSREVRQSLSVQPLNNTSTKHQIVKVATTQKTEVGQNSIGISCLLCFSHQTIVN